jgi:hypothetical protein
VIIQKPEGLFIRIQGSARKTKGQRVNSYKTEGFFSKIAARRGTNSPQPSDPRSTAENRSASECAGAGAHWPAGQGGQRPGAGKRTDRSGPVPGAQAADRWVQVQGAHAQSGTGGPDRVIEIRRVAELPELFQLKCLSPALEARPHLNGNNPSIPRI